MHLARSHVSTPLRTVLRAGRIGVVLAVLFTAAIAGADEVGRRGDDDGGPRRSGIDDDRVGRRPLDGMGGAETSSEDKGSTKQINLLTQIRCGVADAPRFRNALLALQNPTESFYIETWGNKRIYYVMDPIYYFFRSNQNAYVTLFWIGPEGSVFVPFMNLPVEKHRNHKIDPSNIIVEPVGLERWRVIATPEPHSLPCDGDGGDFLAALRKIQAGGKWAAGRWDVTSKSSRSTRPRRFR